MVGALIIGIPLAYFTTRYQIKGKSLITTLAILALVSPPFIGAYAWITMLGSNGWLRHLLQNFGIFIPTIYGPFGIILVLDMISSFPEKQRKMQEINSINGIQLIDTASSMQTSETHGKF